MMIPQDFYCQAGSEPTLPTLRRVDEYGLQRNNPATWIRAIRDGWLPGKFAFSCVENNIPLFLFLLLLLSCFYLFIRWPQAEMDLYKSGEEEGEQKRAPCPHGFALGKYLPVWSNLWMAFF